MSKPTDDQLETVLSLLRGGADLDAALVHNGIDPLEFDEWLGKPRNRGVAASVKRALAQADLTDLGTIASASKDSWQAAKARYELRTVRARERELLELNAIAGC
jgi:hypothetical protein